MDRNTNSYSDADLHAEFDRLFPQGFAGPDVLLDLAPDGWENSPSEALAKEAGQNEHDQKLAEFRESLDEGYREAIEEALNAPPPRTVQAYEAVYGRFPLGWPPIP